MILTHVDLIEKILVDEPSRLTETRRQAYYDNALCTRMLDRKQPIVLVGESPTRQHALALAILRGSLDGIWATSLAPIDVWPIQKLLDKIHSLQRAKNGSDIEKLTAFHTYVQSTHDLSLEQLFFQANATNLQVFFSREERPPTANIWFQCPWVLECGTGTTAELLRSFVASAARVQVVGDFLLIGLLDGHAKEYHHKYELDQLFQHARSCGYSFKYTDNILIKQCLEYGYELWTDAKGKAEELHRYAQDKHDTYVFERMPPHEIHPEHRSSSTINIHQEVNHEKDALVDGLSDALSSLNLNDQTL